MLSEEMSLDIEKEVIVGLVGNHERGPAVTVGLPPLMLPFDAAEADSGGGFTDLLQILACGFRVEVRFGGA